MFRKKILRLEWQGIIYRNLGDVWAVLDGQILMTYNELKKEAEGNTKNK